MSMDGLSCRNLDRNRVREREVETPSQTQNPSTIWHQHRSERRSEYDVANIESAIALEMQESIDSNQGVYEVRFGDTLEELNQAVREIYSDDFEGTNLFETQGQLEEFLREQNVINQRGYLLAEESFNVVDYVNSLSLNEECSPAELPAETTEIMDRTPARRPSERTEEDVNGTSEVDNPEEETSIENYEFQSEHGRYLAERVEELEQQRAEGVEVPTLSPNPNINRQTGDNSETPENLSMFERIRPARRPEQGAADSAGSGESGLPDEIRGLMQRTPARRPEQESEDTSTTGTTIPPGLSMFEGIRPGRKPEQDSEEINIFNFDRTSTVPTRFSGNGENLFSIGNLENQNPANNIRLENITENPQLPGLDFLGLTRGNSPSGTAEPGTGDDFAEEISAITEIIPGRVGDREERESWANQIIEEMSANDIPVTPENIAFILSTMDRESSFQTDPAIPGPESIRDNFKNMIRERGDSVIGLPDMVYGPIDSFIDEVFERYNLGEISTERELEERIAAHRDEVFELAQSQWWYNFIPDSVIEEGLARMNEPVETVGLFQLDVDRAMRFAEEEGRDISREEMRELLYTPEGAMHYGIRNLAASMNPYINRTDISAEDRARFSAADYQAGPYASRNARIQQIISQLTGTDLALDGDLLPYNEDGNPADFTGNTEAAIRQFVRTNNLGYSDSEVRNFLTMEKTGDFESTPLYSAIREALSGGADVYAILPAGVSTDENLTAEAKFGQNFTSEGYVRGTLQRWQRYLSLLP